MIHLDNEELARIQEKMFHDAITVPEEQERIILDTAQHVAQRLYFQPNKEVRIEVLDHKYIFMATNKVIDFKQIIWIVVMDENDMVEDKIRHCTRPRTFNINAEVDNNLSMMENYRACICAFLRNQVGDYMPEEMED